MIAVSIEKKKLYQERARKKELERRSSDVYKEKTFKQAKASQERSIAKQREKQKSSVVNKTRSKPNSKSGKQKSPIKTGSLVKASPPAKPRTPIKSKGLMGVSRTKYEVELHGKMSDLGCICCIKKGLIQPFSGAWVTIHHTAGRTKAHCHKRCLPLCEWHHDKPIEKDHPYFTLRPDLFPIHAKGSIGGRVPWEKENGTQEALLIDVLTFIDEQSLIVELELHCQALAMEDM
jgi:hypothetical protein